MFFIDTLSEVPIYTQICNGIIKEIAEGNLKNGDELPSVRQLAKDFGINPMTVNKIALKDKENLCPIIPIPMTLDVTRLINSDNMMATGRPIASANKSLRISSR